MFLGGGGGGGTPKITIFDPPPKPQKKLWGPIFLTFFDIFSIFRKPVIRLCGEETHVHVYPDPHMTLAFIIIVMHVVHRTTHQSWDREFVSKTSPHSNVRQPNDDFLKNVKKTHFLSKNHLSAALPLEGEVFLTNLALPLWWCVDARQQRLPPLCITASYTT